MNIKRYIKIIILLGLVNIMLFEIPDKKDFKVYTLKRLGWTEAGSYDEKTNTGDLDNLLNYIAGSPFEPEDIVAIAIATKSPNGTEIHNVFFTPRGIEEKKREDEIGKVYSKLNSDVHIFDVFLKELDRFNMNFVYKNISSNPVYPLCAPKGELIDWGDSDGKTNRVIALYIIDRTEDTFETMSNDKRKEEWTDLDAKGNHSRKWLWYNGPFEEEEMDLDNIKMLGWTYDGNYGKNTDTVNLDKLLNYVTDSPYNPDDFVAVAIVTGGIFDGSPLKFKNVYLTARGVDEAGRADEIGAVYSEFRKYLDDSCIFDELNLSNAKDILELISCGPDKTSLVPKGELINWGDPDGKTNRVIAVYNVDVA